MHGNSGAGSGRHLTEDQFEELLHADLAPSERQVLQAHLSTCADCQQAFADYRTIADLLGALPQVAVPRSFQLTPDQARVGVSVWSRLAAFLFPMLPAMRAATLALILMFGAVTAARLVDDSTDSSGSIDFAADLVPTETVAQQPAPELEEPPDDEAIATQPEDPAARKDPEESDNVTLGESDEAPTEAADQASQSGPADDGGDVAGTGPADDGGDAAGTGPADQADQTGPAGDVAPEPEDSDVVEESSSTGPVDDASDAAASGPADEADLETMETFEMQSPPGDAPEETAETTEAFESAPADEDSSNAAGSTEMQLPGVASPEATATETASPTPSSTSTATATASPSATMTAAPTATPTPTPDLSDDDGFNVGDWPLGGMQVIFGALVLILGSVIVAVSRTGRRS